jgi:hypothetical protein
MECSVCLEDNIPEEECVVTKCGHSFHKACFEKILDFTDKMCVSCPYCRTNLNVEMIRYKLNSSNSFYAFNKIKRKSVSVSGGSDIIFLEKILKNQAPQAWLDIPLYKSSDIFRQLMPLYKIEYQNKQIYISSYTRLVLLYTDMKKIVLNKKYETGKECYYEINLTNSDVQEEYGIFKLYKNDFHTLIYSWVYDLMQYLKTTFNFVFSPAFNSLIMDIFVETLIHFNLTNKSYYQFVAGSAVYNIVILFFPELKYNKDFNWDIIYDFSANYVTFEVSKPYIDFQKKLIEEKIRLTF